MVSWRLMKRADGTSATWTEEATGISTDDVTLSRDPRSDVAHVTAWPNSVPTTYSSPSFTPMAIPGRWSNIPVTGRQYGNTGIGPDGSLCIKASVEATTANTSTQYSCGKYDASTKKWTWGPQLTKAIGKRRSYDYLFPGGTGDATKLLATSQLDLYKDAAGLMSLAATQGNYVFNGAGQYLTGTNDLNGWQISSTVDPYFVPASASAAPYVRQIDSFVDSKKRVFTSYWVDDPLLATPRGLYVAVSDSTGAVLYRAQWTTLPSYGYVRVFEDSTARLWLLWTNQGTQQTQMQLYRINEISTPKLSLSLSAKTELSSKFAPYSILGSTQLAVQRGGQTVGNALDGVMVACDGTYSSGKTLVCEPNGAGKQRLFHFRIRLPN